jgi:MoxR-like ATPase
MEFYINETKRTVKAKHRPIVIITSNAEKELPDAFLRRCIFHYIDFPTKELMEEIVRVHFPNVEENLLKNAMEVFYNIRTIRDIRKKPSTSELIDWVNALQIGGIPTEKIKKELPFIGVVVKKDEDLDLVKHGNTF